MQAQHVLIALEMAMGEHTCILEQDGAAVRTA
jgi:hypothetical protein